MPKAVWNGQVIAESDKTVVVEGNHYFPVESIRQEFFVESNESSRCPWKGVASYYDVALDGAENKGAAWYYPDPSRAAKKIKNHVAFWRGVKIEA